MEDAAIRHGKGRLAALHPAGRDDDERPRRFIAAIGEDPGEVELELRVEADDPRRVERQAIASRKSAMSAADSAVWRAP